MLAKRLKEIAPFRVMKILARANELQKSGKDVIHMEVGEPDFPTSPHIVSRGVDALKSGLTRYTDARGTPELRELIARHYADQYSVDVSPERIFVTAGASGGLLLLSALTMDPGDNLLMTDPGYPCNRHFLSSFNAEGRLVPVGAEHNYQLNCSLVEHFWDERTKGVLIASPANPTGSVLGLQELARLSRLIEKKSGVMIVDEIYQGLVYEDNQSGTVLSINPKAFVVNSFSKYFGMTGWRLGWVVVPEDATRALEKLAQNLFICASSIAQAAALAAFDTRARDYMASCKAELKTRRDFLVPALQELGFDINGLPDGAFYIYAGLPDEWPAAESFCEQLLEEDFVAVTPGTDFGFHRADRFVRFSYAQKLDRLEAAVERLAQRRW